MPGANSRIQRGSCHPPPPGVYPLSVFSYVHLPVHAASAWLRTGDPTDPAWLRHHKARARGRAHSGGVPMVPRHSPFMIWSRSWRENIRAIDWVPRLMAYSLLPLLPPWGGHRGHCPHRGLWHPVNLSRPFRVFFSYSPPPHDLRVPSPHHEASAPCGHPPEQCTAIALEQLDQGLTFNQPRFFPPLLRLARVSDASRTRNLSFFLNRVITTRPFLVAFPPSPLVLADSIAYHLRVCLAIVTIHQRCG